MKIPGYTIIRELGSGGMATVYLARQDRLTRDVALKVMKPLAIAGGDFTSRFIKEGQIIAQLQHPQIITIYDFDSSDGLHYFSMEYLPGGALADEIKKGLSSVRALMITRKIAEALAVAHALGIIHRDVKPQNILFRTDGSPVLTDFGIARAEKRHAESMQLTRVGMVIGSPRYMSPEQSTGQPIDARSDLYSLGVVFYEMLTRQLPYRADDVVSLAMKHCTDPIPRLPEHLAVYQPILDQLLAKKPADRFATASQLIRVLEVAESATQSTGASDATTQLADPGVNARTLLQSDGTSDATTQLAAPGVNARTLLQSDGTGGATTQLAAPGVNPQTRHQSRIALRGLRLFWVVLAIAILAGVGLYLALRTPHEHPPESSIADQLPLERADRPQTAIQYEKLVIEHFQKAEYEQSLEIVRLGLSITPDDNRLAVLKSLIQDRIEVEKQYADARELLRENLLDASLTLAEAGLKRIPNHPGLIALHAELRQRVAQRSQHQADTLLARAQSSFQAGEIEDATSKVREGLRLVPDHPALIQLQDQIQAAIEQRQATQDAIQQANTLLASGKLSESMAFIARALELAPNDAQLLDLRATAEKQLQRQREKRLTDLLEQARELMAAGAFQQSQSVIEEGLRLAPEHAEFTTLHDQITALQQTGSRVAQRVKDCDLQFPPAELSAETGMTAASCYLQVATLDPANAQIRYRIERIAEVMVERIDSLLKGDQLDAAAKALGQLQSIAPEHPKLMPLKDNLNQRRKLSPRMIDIAGGCFAMGSPSTELGREDDERQHQVCVKPFRLGQFEVSVEEFKRFTQASGYRTDAEQDVGGLDGCWALDQEGKTDVWKNQPWASWLQPNRDQAARDQEPVSCVSWHDAQAYLRWLNQETDGVFRLPTEAEWEYAARAGSTTARYWGDAVDKSACRYANTADAGHGWADGFPCDDHLEWVAPIGSFEPNAWGLKDMLGNLWEWTCSEYDATYAGTEQVCAPITSEDPRIMRGGAWNSAPGPVRSAYRNRNFPESRYSFVGFRIARDTPSVSGAR